MALVVLRGAILGELADRVATEAIVSLFIFSGIGWIAGWIADYLITDAIEQAFRRRVEWYRDGITEQLAAAEEQAKKTTSVKES